VQIFIQLVNQSYIMEWCNGSKK